MKSLSRGFDPSSALQIFELSAQHAAQYRKDEGHSIQMLAYCFEDQVIEMAQLARRGNGTYWWFVTTPKIHCRHTANIEYKDLETARSSMVAYVKQEIIRVWNLKKPVFHHDLPMTEMRKTDMRVCEIQECNTRDFQEGMDWAFRTMGFPRRPVWAKYLVQNRDKSFYWLENEPYQDHQSGRWQQKEDGRFLNVTLDATTAKQWEWTKQIRRVK